MHKGTPHIQMQNNVIYSFKYEINRGDKGVIVYRRTKGSTEALTIL